MNKLQDYDDISIRMLKIFIDPIVKFLSILFSNHFGSFFYLDSWKKIKCSTYSLRKQQANCQ